MKYPAIFHLFIACLLVAFLTSCTEQSDRFALNFFEKTYGPDSHAVAARLTSLANRYSKSGRYDLAEPLYERAIAIDEKLNFSTLSTTLAQTADMYEKKGNILYARGLLEKALEVDEGRLGRYHPKLTKSLVRLGQFHARHENYLAAEPLLTKALELDISTAKMDYHDEDCDRSEECRCYKPRVANRLKDLASVKAKLGKSDEYVELVGKLEEYKKRHKSLEAMLREKIGL